MKPYEIEYLRQSALMRVAQLEYLVAELERLAMRQDTLREMDAINLAANVIRQLLEDVNAN